MSLCSIAPHGRLPAVGLGLAQHHQYEVTTKALEAFLQARPPRRLVGEEALAHLREALSDPDAPAKALVYEDTPARILALWRLARQTARMAGICGEDEPLDNATEMEPSPWYNPLKPRLAPSEQAVMRRASATELLHYIGEGIPLLPPRDEAAAAQWCAAMSIMAGELNITGTDVGERGLRGLLNPKTAHLCSVTHREILALEELLIDEAQRLMVECGERPAIDHFRHHYGFARKEAVALMRLARADMLATGGSSVEEDRAIMVAQLKDVVARCKEEMNSERELKALKMLAAVQGLTRSEPDDQARDFINVIASVARKQDAALAAGPRPAMLAQFSVVERDPDDEQFDRENL